MKYIKVEQAKTYLERELSQLGYIVSIKDYGEYILINGFNINQRSLHVPRKTWNRQDGIEFVVKQIKHQLFSM
jgi:hypothetical protein